MSRLLATALILSSCVTEDGHIPSQIPPKSAPKYCHTHVDCMDTGSFCYNPAVDGISSECLKFCKVDRDCPNDLLCRGVGDIMSAVIDFGLGTRDYKFWGCVSPMTWVYPKEY